MDKRLKEMERDGNCLFRCLAFSHYGSQRFHRKIRTEIVLYVIENWSNFESFIVGDSSYHVTVKNKQDYASHMGSDGIFGGEIELTAFVKMYEQYCIHILHHDSENSKTYGKGLTSIFLKYSGEYDTGHYDVLISIPTSSRFLKHKPIFMTNDDTACSDTVPKREIAPASTTSTLRISRPECKEETKRKLITVPLCTTPKRRAAQETISSTSIILPKPEEKRKKNPISVPLRATPKRKAAQATISSPSIILPKPEEEPKKKAIYTPLHTTPKRKAARATTSTPRITLPEHKKESKGKIISVSLHATPKRKAARVLSNASTLHTILPQPKHEEKPKANVISRCEVITNVNENRKLKKIPSDGNCLFRCLAFHQHNDQQFHLQIREEIASYVLNNWSDFEAFVLQNSSYTIDIKTKQKYASYMSCKGNYAGEVELMAFVKMNTEYSISVFTDNSGSGVPTTYGTGQTCIHLKYSTLNNQGHYDILILPRKCKRKISNIECKLPSTEPSFPKKTKIDARKTNEQIRFLGSTQNSTKSIIQFNVGNLDVKCQYCGALSFRKEPGRVVNNCCHSGKVRLPPLQKYPDRLRSLLQDNSKEAVAFRSNIRSYNSAFSFACFHANFCDFQNKYAPILKIHGQVYHMGTASLQSSNSPRNGQIYIYDGDIVQKLRSNCANTDPVLLQEIEALLRNQNPYAKFYKTLHEKYNESNTNQEMSLNFVRFNCDDKRLYNAPVTGEIAAVIVSKDGAIPKNIDFRVFPRHNKDYEIIPKTSQHLDPMTFPLFFPSGDLGWNFVMKQMLNADLSNKRISPVQYYGYRLAMRGDFNPILYGGRLTQQYVIHAYIITESQRLDYLRFNQGTLRRECYQGLIDHIKNSKANSSDPIRLGSMVILPSTYIGSPRCMQQLYLDAMAMSRKIGRPDLFITMTCNPDWPEFKQILSDFPVSTKISDLPCIVCRVFNMKLLELVNEIYDGKVFGPVVGYVYTVEFQKRGLPHGHILFILRQDCKLLTPEAVDGYISAEIPDKQSDADLHNLVMKHMLHGPHSSSTICWNEEKKTCTKNFPKPFNNETNLKVNGYPQYKRRDNTSKLYTYNARINGKPVYVDNRMVVPYNPYLLKKYNCHINVEYCASVMSVKYIHKYIHKGHDRARISVNSKDNTSPTDNSNQASDFDEIKTFIDSRYVSPMEAAWRILELPLHGRSHTVFRLPVHLDGQQHITFEEGKEDDAIKKKDVQVTPLIGWFQLNKCDENAKTILYADIPLHYRWDSGKKCWIKRKNAINIVSRIVAVSPKDMERFHLKLILSRIPGAISYSCLRTVNGTILDLFRETAVVLGLSVNSNEALEVMKEAAEIMLPSRLRKFFVWYIVGEMPPDALSLWQDFKAVLCEDFQNYVNPEATALCEIEKLFNYEGLSGTTFGLPFTDVSMMDNFHNIPSDMEKHEKIAESLISQLNKEQNSIFQHIMKSITNESTQKCFFIDGPGGTGKTFLYSAIYHKLKGLQKNVATVAWTGIASILLPGGTTSHKMFNLPINLTEDHVSQLKKRDKVRLHAMEVFIWDEASMIPRMALETVDRTLRDLMNNNLPFGGKFFILGGDFRQVLPVVKRASKLQIIAETIKQSYLWSKFITFKLTRNMRANEDSKEFSKWLLDIGNGVTDFLEITESLHSNNLVEEMYSNVSEEDLASQAILSPQNMEVNRINEKILNLLPGKMQYVYSIDRATLPGIDKSEQSDEEATLRYPIEYLNSLTPSGLPPHKLSLKVGAIVMLIRNLSVSDGLCNGTRLIVREIRRRIIITQIMTGTKKGEIAEIPRIELNTADDKEIPFVLYRRQFPVKLAYAMTINKAQGQSFDRVGLYIDRPIFGHGQLYVALSRCRSKEAIKIMMKESYITNIVYKEVL